MSLPTISTHYGVAYYGKRFITWLKWAPPFYLLHTMFWRLSESLIVWQLLTRAE